VGPSTERQFLTLGLSSVSVESGVISPCALQGYIVGTTIQCTTPASYLQLHGGNLWGSQARDCVLLQNGAQAWLGTVQNECPVLMSNSGLSTRCVKAVGGNTWAAVNFVGFSGPNNFMHAESQALIEVGYQFLAGRPFGNCTAAAAYDLLGAGRMIFWEAPLVTGHQGGGANADGVLDNNGSGLIIANASIAAPNTIRNGTDAAGAPAWLSWVTHRQ